MSNRTTTNISDQLDLIAWVHNNWHESVDADGSQSDYLAGLLMEFARSNPPEVLLPEEHAAFMQIAQDLEAARGASGDDFNS